MAKNNMLINTGCLEVDYSFEIRFALMVTTSRDDLREFRGGWLLLIVENYEAQVREQDAVRREQDAIKQKERLRLHKLNKTSFKKRVHQGFRKSSNRLTGFLYASTT